MWPNAFYTEIFILQTHFTSSESTMQGYIQEVDRLKRELLESEKNSSKLRTEIDASKRELGNEHKKLERQSSVSKADKVKLNLW